MNKDKIFKITIFVLTLFVIVEVVFFDLELFEKATFLCVLVVWVVGCFSIHKTSYSLVVLLVFYYSFYIFA